MEYIHDDGPGPCPKCGEPANVRTCDGCGVVGRIIDCGHEVQPRPIAAGRADGSKLNRDFCDECAEEKGD